MNGIFDDNMKGLMQAAQAKSDAMAELHTLADSIATSFKPIASDFDDGMVTLIALPGGNIRSVLRKLGGPLPCLCVTGIVNHLFSIVNANNRIFMTFGHIAIFLFLEVSVTYG